MTHLKYLIFVFMCCETHPVEALATAALAYDLMGFFPPVWQSNDKHSMNVETFFCKCVTAVCCVFLAGIGFCLSCYVADSQTSSVFTGPDQL